MDAIYTLRGAIEENINKNKTREYVLFAVLKGAFNRINREEIWKRMKELGIEEELTDCIRDIYGDTMVQVRIDSTTVGRLKLNSRVRQGYPASPTLFNISMSDLETEVAKTQEGGVVLGNRKIFSVFYADDIAILATLPEGLKEMMKRLHRYLEKKGLELNTGKTKRLLYSGRAKEVGVGRCN